MSQYLLIVESPSKARTIRKYLGRDYHVLASVGHIKDLPEKELGIDLNKNFRPRYVTIKGKTQIIKQLKSAAQTARKIFLAPDPDREGEAIAWHIAEVLNAPAENIQRVLFNEITKSGIAYGLQHPRQIDLSLVNAQQARRVLDRIVGYQVSPFLWRTLYRGLSAGRVQSVAVRIICEREVEVEQFIPREYWEISAELATAEGSTFTAKLVQIGKQKPIIPDETTAREHVLRLQRLSSKLLLSNSKTSPNPPRHLSLPARSSRKPCGASVFHPKEPCASPKTCTKEWQSRASPSD